MRRFGFFNEVPETERKQTILSLQSPAARPDEDRALGYLARGVLIGVAMCVETDPLSDPPTMIGPPNARTDGVWLWPETLSYYVRRYHVRLPEELLAHMRQNGWECPQAVNHEALCTDNDEILG